MTTQTAHEAVAATFNPLRKVYSRMNYDQFCEVIGEQAYFGHVNPYAWGKWCEFQDLMKAYDKLGTLMPRLVTAGEAL